MVTTAGRRVSLVAPTSGRTVPPEATARSAVPVPSTAILEQAVEVERMLERRLAAHEDGRPSISAGGVERLEVRARARAWAVPPVVVQRADRILHAAANAEATISATCWCESLPDEILDLLERRRPGPGLAGRAGAGHPLHRVTDR